MNKRSNHQKIDKSRERRGGEGILKKEREWLLFYDDSEERYEKKKSCNGIDLRSEREWRGEGETNDAL